MAIKSLKALVAAANRLKELRTQKDTLYTAYRTTVAPMEEEIEKLNQDLLNGFRSIGVNNVSLDTGEKYTRVVKKALEITNEAFALKWAIDSHAVKIDSRLVAQKLKDVETTPPGFKYIEREEVRVTKPSEKKGEEQVTE